MDSDFGNRPPRRPGPPGGSGGGPQPPRQPGPGRPQPPRAVPPKPQAGPRPQGQQRPPSDGPSPARQPAKPPQQKPAQQQKPVQQQKSGQPAPAQKAAARPAPSKPAAAKPAAAKPAERRPAGGFSRNTAAKRAGMTALALVSTMALVVTGYAWATLDSLNSGLATDNVIKADKPADGATDVLLVGLDSRTDAHGNPLPAQLLAQLNAGQDDGELNTDTLILVHIPNDTSKPAALLSIPRDSYVDIPGGYGQHKINSAYARAMNDEASTLRNQGQTDAKAIAQQSQSAGRKELISTIEQLTGATIDHYAEINLYGFSEITTAIGGVKVCLKAPAKDSFSGANFPAGEQSISGVDALKFVRQRHGLPNGDLDRIKRQQVFMAGLASTVLSGGTLTNPGKLTSLINAIKNAVVLDQGWDLLGFATQLKGMTGGGLHFQTIPTGRPDLPTPDDGQAVEVDPAQVKAFVQQLTGLTPTATSTSASGPASTGSNVTVEVRNANGKAGLAASVMSALVAKGFVQGDTGTATPRSKSVIRYPSGGAANAQKVSDALGGGYDVEEDNADGIQPGHVRIFLSTNYDGPGSEGFTGPAAYALAPTGGATTPAAPSSDTITADGITCVN
ncbi:LCP family protein [Kutzneria buriramensis]|uniref:LCP family protein required for cell wall assembly n=1 Tax=Kutzneria buriramensis TaxID=1045776 RepID=A0A3E0IBL1_9PSEU|nr:LCP family protein [Kutzneria buriramensis]REH55946.1 LCP family protein required for cell wall assembly [Kutzneria buriramensis]